MTKKEQEKLDNFIIDRYIEEHATLHTHIDKETCRIELKKTIIEKIPLLSCPFCNNSVFKMSYEDKEFAKIICKCGASMTYYNEERNKSKSEMYKAVAELWNKRS